MVKVIVELEFRRFCARPFWPGLLVLTVATAPLALSPYFPRFLPALASALVVVQADLMDMFGSRDGELRKYIALPVSMRDVIIGKGLMTMVKAILGAFVAGAIHAWLAGAPFDSEHAFWSFTGFLATLPALVHVGARSSISAAAAPSTGVFEPVVRVVLTLLAAAVCAIPAQMISAIGSPIVLAFYAIASFGLWVSIGTRSAAGRLQRWMQSSAYTL